MPHEGQRRRRVADGRQEARNVECGLGHHEQVHARQAALGPLRQHLRGAHSQCMPCLAEAISGPTDLIGQARTACDNALLRDCRAHCRDLAECLKHQLRS